MKVITKDNSDKVLQEIARRKKAALHGMGIEAEGFAKSDPNMPVDTGRARNSITSALSGEKPNITEYTDDAGTNSWRYEGKAEGKVGEAVFIGSNVEYFPTIELGGQNRQAHHVLQRAATQHTDRYKEIWKDAFKS